MFLPFSQDISADTNLESWNSIWYPISATRSNHRNLSKKHKVHIDKRTETPSGKQGTNRQNQTKPSKNKGQQAVAHLKEKQTLIFPVTVPIDSISRCCIQNNSKMRPIPFKEKQTLIFPATVPIDSISGCCIQKYRKMRPIPFKEKQTLIFPFTVPIANV